jgi:hypothetical protein
MNRTFLFFLILITVTFTGLMLTSCDSTPGSAPYEISPTVLSGLSVNPGNVTFTPEDGLRDSTLVITISVNKTGDINPKSVQFTIKDDFLNEPAGQGELQLSGGIYTGTFDLTVSTSTINTYTVSVFGETPGGTLTNTIQTKIRITGILTEPPQIEFLNHPQTVQIPSTGTQAFGFEAKVVHPNGQMNITDVFLELYDSNNIQIGGRAFRMFDDGDTSGSGDLVPNDSVYTKSFQIGPQNSPDTYTIWCYAIDRQGTSSDTTFSTLSIIQ